mmetsp:Transcript_33769/g.102006  ORF Transcript_33769/g.102006 Transcript_33769/m.102006 type:complete len:306 (-) Transcript_33769:222-1139(-)
MGQKACSSVCSEFALKEQLTVPAAFGGGHHQHDEGYCVCGNKYLPDSIFCRKCGTKKPDHALSPQVCFVAWMRRRNGVDCDFGAVFEELFGSQHPVPLRKWVSVLDEHGCHFDSKAVFAFLDRHTKVGQVGAADLILYQSEIDDKEVDSLKHLREFLKSTYKSPLAAFRDMGKGEGEVLSRHEFVAALTRLGFQAEDPEMLFNMVDKDYSGEVCYNEFKSVLKNAGKNNGYHGDEHHHHHENHHHQHHHQRHHGHSEHHHGNHGDHHNGHHGDHHHGKHGDHHHGKHGGHHGDHHHARFQKQQDH